MQAAEEPRAADDVVAVGPRWAWIPWVLSAQHELTVSHEGRMMRLRRTIGMR